MKQPKVPRKKKLINWFRIEHKDGAVIEMNCVRYFVGMYIVLYVNGSLAYQGGNQTLESPNRKARAMIADAKEKGAKVEFTEIEVYPPGVWSPEELAEQQARNHAGEEETQEGQASQAGAAEQGTEAKAPAEAAAAGS
jgi:hypothetical protein